MKKLVAIALLISVFGLSGCSVDWNDEKEKKIVELEKRVSQLNIAVSPASFERMKECQWYSSEIMKKIPQNEAIYQHRDYVHSEKLTDVFYSPIRNSCLYSVTVTEIQSWKVCEFNKIYDYLSYGQDEVWHYLEFKKDEKGLITDECDSIASAKSYSNAVIALKWQ